MLNRNSKIEILYEHYEKSNNICRENIRVRNKFYVLMMFIFVLQISIIGFEDSFASTLQKYLMLQHSIDITIQYNLFSAFIWIIKLYIVIRYYQSLLSVEKNYEYLHEKEKELEKNGIKEINREGKSYLNNYELTLDIIHVVYQILSPAICMILNIYCIYNDFVSGKITILFLVNFICAFIIFIILISNFISNIKKMFKHLLKT